jgi:hypothetical protein
LARAYANQASKPGGGGSPAWRRRYSAAAAGRVADWRARRAVKLATAAAMMVVSGCVPFEGAPGGGGRAGGERGCCGERRERRTVRVVRRRMAWGMRGWKGGEDRSRWMVKAERSHRMPSQMSRGRGRATIEGRHVPPTMVMEVLRGSYCRICRGSLDLHSAVEM